MALADGSLDPALVGSGWRKTNRELADGTADDGGMGLLSSGRASVAAADRIKANALALKHVLAVRQTTGELIEAELAERVLFEAARGLRDAWSNWPARVGPLIAADLGVSVEAVVEALTAHVHQQLADLGEPEDAIGAWTPRNGMAQRTDAAPEDQRPGVG